MPDRCGEQLTKRQVCGKHSKPKLCLRACVFPHSAHLVKHGLCCPFQVLKTDITWVDGQDTSCTTFIAVAICLTLKISHIGTDLTHPPSAFPDSWGDSYTGKIDL